MIPSTVPMYCCTRPLEKTEAQICYGEKNANITVSCDGGYGSFSGSDIIWHCADTITELHPNGFDLSDKAAMRMVNFDELRGLKLSQLKRDERYKIRVTLLYYKQTINGIIDEPLIRDIIQKLMRSETLGRVQPQQIPPTQQQQVPIPIQSTPRGQPTSTQSSISPLSGNNVNPPQITQQIQPQPIQQIQSIQPIVPIQAPPPSIPKGPMNAADYQLVGKALKELQLNDGYLKVFQGQRVRDVDLLLLEDMDLMVLFPDSVGARIRFRDWIKRNRRLLSGDKTPVNRNDYVQIGNIFKTLQIQNAQKYISNFINYKVTDKMLPYLLSCDNELEEIIPDLGVRIAFKGYLAKQQQPPPQRQIIMPQQTMGQPMQQQMTQNMGGSNSGFLF